MRLRVDRQSQRTYKISPANRPTQWDRSIEMTVHFAIASGTEIYTLVGHPALTRIFMALQHELGPLGLITCGRKEAATTVDSVAVDVLDSLAIKGTRVALVLLAPVPDTGILVHEASGSITGPHATCNKVLDSITVRILL